MHRWILVLVLLLSRHFSKYGGYHKMYRLIFNMLMSFFLMFILAVPQASAHSATRIQKQLLKAIGSTYAAMGEAWYSGDLDAGQTISSYYATDGILYSPVGVHQNIVLDDMGWSEVALTFKALIDAGYDFELESGTFPLPEGSESICVDDRRREQGVDVLKPLLDVYGEDAKLMAVEIGCYRLSGPGLKEFKGNYNILWKGTVERDLRGHRTLKWLIYRDTLNHVD